MRTAFTLLSLFFALAIINTGEQTAMAAAAKGDTDKSAPTATDQQENEADRKISQQIRQAVTKDDSLSVSAQNIKIITQDGKVTLRGSVKNDSEKQKIAEKAKQVAGVKNVENLITIGGEKGEK
jgi:osmotically-inducible protein OsmY